MHECTIYSISLNAYPLIRKIAIIFVTEKFIRVISVEKEEYLDVISLYLFQIIVYFNKLYENKSIVY